MILSFCMCFYYICSGALSLLVSAIILKFIYFVYKMESNVDITYPDIPQSASELDKYKLRLIQAHVKTEEDLNKMSQNDIKKEYLKHEQAMIEKMSTNLTKMITKAYTNSVSNILPIEQPESLENKLNDDVFLKAAINEYLPPLYYRFGALLAPLTVIATTATHVNYKNIELLNLFKNERNEEKPKETEADAIRDE